jgi:uncharacterized protein (TIGR01244 family)
LEQEDERPIVGLPYGYHPLPGIATAGQPTEQDLARVAEAGYKTVVDVRPLTEPRGFDEPAAVELHGMEYVNIPVVGAPIADHQFDRFRAVLADPAKRPVLVHCRSANRVGALMIPFMVLDQDRPLEEALSLARQIGLRSWELSQAALGYLALHAE